MYNLSEVRFEIKNIEDKNYNFIIAKCSNHPIKNSSEDIMPSVPIIFDAETNIFTSICGSTYQIIDYSMDKQEFIQEINSCINNKSYLLN